MIKWKRHAFPCTIEPLTSKSIYIAISRCRHNYRDDKCVVWDFFVVVVVVANKTWIAPRTHKLLRKWWDRLNWLNNLSRWTISQNISHHIHQGIIYPFKHNMVSYQFTKSICNHLCFNNDYINRDQETET